MRESIKSICIAVFLFATVATPFAWLWERPGPLCWSIRLGGPLLDVIAVWLIFKLERESSATSTAQSRQTSRPQTSRSSSEDRRLADGMELKRSAAAEISGDSAESLLRQWEQTSETVDHAATTESVPRNPWSDPRDKAIMAAILIFGAACGAVSYWYYRDWSALPGRLSFVVFGFTGYLPAHLFAVQVNKRFRMRSKDEFLRLQPSEPTATAPEPVSLSLKTRRLVFSMVLCGCLLPLTMWGMATIWNAARSSAWPSVAGTLTTFDVFRSGKSTRVDLRYRYRVGNSDYSGDRIDLAGSFPGLCPQDIWAGFSPNATVRVYYDPQNPSSAALVKGVPTPLKWLAFPLVLVAIGSVLFAWSNWVAFTESAGVRPTLNPDLEDPRSIAHRAVIAIGGTLMVYVFGCFTVRLVMLSSTVPLNSRDAFVMVLATIAGLGLALLPLTFTWLGSLVVYSAFKRPETLNDLRNTPDAPRFSESSLVCFQASLSSSTAIIVDHERGKIHFRKTHRERGKFIGWPQKWFTCRLSEVRQAKRHIQIVKGNRYETLQIQTPHGQANVSSTMPNYAALCEFFEAG